MAIAWAAVAASTLGGALKGQQRNNAILEEAKRFGTLEADIEHRVEQTLASGAEAVNALQASTTNTKLQTTLNEQQSQAEATISAAAAGAEGGSVDQTLNQIATNADISRANTDIQQDATLRNIQNNVSDAIISETSRRGESPSDKMGSPLLQGALSGMFKWGELHL